MCESCGQDHRITCDVIFDDNERFSICDVCVSALGRLSDILPYPHTISFTAKHHA